MRNVCKCFILFFGGIFFILSICIPGGAENSWREMYLYRRAQRLAAKKDAPTADEIRGSLIQNGLERTYLLHVPEGYDGKQTLPLVIVMHGGAGKATSAVRMAEMDPLADQEGFFVVYPNAAVGMGGRQFWNCCDDYQRSQSDDIGFFRALLDKLEKEYLINPKRIYATGLSNGGKMAHRLGCDLSDKIAAIAPVAGALDLDNPHASEPVSVIIFHGTADQYLPYNGGISQKAALGKGSEKSVAYALSFWIKNNGCQPTPKREQFGNIVHETYGGGKNNSEVQLYTILGQGHAWPGGKYGPIYENLDPPTQEISATQLMWKFFKDHPKL